MEVGTICQKIVVILEVRSDARDLSALVFASLQSLTVSHLTYPLPPCRACADKIEETKSSGGASKRGTQRVTRSTAQAHEMGDSQSSTRLLYFYEICRLLRRLALFSFRQPRVSLRYARLHPGLYADTRIRGLRIPRPHHLFQITFATRSYSWASVISRLMKSPGFAAKPSGTSLIST